MDEKNWVVPVTLKDSYWNVRLYFAGFETAEAAKNAAIWSIDGLATYVKPTRPFVVGEPEEIR